MENNVPNCPQTIVPIQHLDLFTQTLDNNENFVLHMIGPFFPLIRQKIMVHLKDNDERTLFKMTLIPGQGTDTVIQLTDTSGQSLLTARGSYGYSMGVWSDNGDQFLGKLESSFVGLHAIGAMNEVLFQTNSGVCCDRSKLVYCAGFVSEFSLISNGVTLACVRKSNDRSVGAEISLFNSRNIDSRTKALLIFTGYYLYVLNLAATHFGRIGTHGFSLRLCYIFVIVNLLVGLTCGIIICLNLQST